MTKTNLRTVVLAAATAALFALAIPAAASAASAVTSGYGTDGGRAQAEVTAGGGSRQLPFTGFDLILVAGGGLLLALAGVALHRATLIPATPTPPTTRGGAARRSRRGRS